MSNLSLREYRVKRNKEVFNIRLKQLNLTLEQYNGLKTSVIAILKGLNAPYMEDVRLFYEVYKQLKISFGSEGILAFDEDIIELLNELIQRSKGGKWYITLKNPDNIRRVHPKVIDLFIYNLGRNGGYTTLIRW